MWKPPNQLIPNESWCGSCGNGSCSGPYSSSSSGAGGAAVVVVVVDVVVVVAVVWEEAVCSVAVKVQAAIGAGTGGVEGISSDTSPPNFNSSFSTIRSVVPTGLNCQLIKHSTN